MTTFAIAVWIFMDFTQLSNEKIPGWLGYIGDYIILPSYKGIIKKTL